MGRPFREHHRSDRIRGKTAQAGKITKDVDKPALKMAMLCISRFDSSRSLWIGLMYAQAFC
jgi:hypothetical protein